MKRFKPIVVANPDYKRCYLKPDDIVEFDDWGFIKFPSECTPFIRKIVELEDEDESDKGNCT